MSFFYLNQRGHSLVGVTVAGALAVTALVGISQLAANYSQQQTKNRKAFELLSKKELALEYLRSKFISREMANGNVGKEWNIRNVGNRVEVSALSSYCYQYNASTKKCSQKDDPIKVPIRDVYRRWQVIDGTNQCVLVTPYQEFSGVADPNMLCAPHYDEYEKDGSRLSSIQTKDTLQGDEQQKAYISVVDLSKFNTIEQDQYLAGTLDDTSILKGLFPMRVAFLSYVMKDAPEPDEITIAFDDGERGQILIPKVTQNAISCGVPERDNPQCLKTKAAKFCGCYDHPAAMQKGETSLADGTDIVLVQAAGNFKVWKEKNGNRILKPTGLWASHSDWQKTLNRAGTAFSDIDYTDVSRIAGRSCPPNVFLNHDQMVAADRCLYYDSGNPAQVLGKANQGVEGEDWLGDWNRPNTGRGTKASYYEGNIKTCADKGMRLPTLYETSVSKPKGSWCFPNNAGLPNGDAITPQLAGDNEGVPTLPNSNNSVAWHHTSSASNIKLVGDGCSLWPYQTWGYWAWYSKLGSVPTGDFPFGNVAGDNFRVRCVLP